MPGPAPRGAGTASPSGGAGTASAGQRRTSAAGGV